MEPIILASSSPRRQQILKSLGIPYIVHPADIDETVPKGMKVDDAISKLKGIRCGFKPTSCPDQLARALEEIKNGNQ